MKLAKDLMNIPIIVEKEAKISDVIKKLETKISRIIVIHAGKHIGIVSEKDISLFLLEDKSNRIMNEILL